MKTILVDAVDCFIDRESNIFKAMHEMLDKFPNRKIILTNADYQDTNQYNLNDAPYEVFTLKHNPDKTSPIYYETMLHHLGLSLDDVVYFEHGEDATESAKSVGIKTYLYNKDKKDLGSLKKFLDDNLNIKT